MRALRRPDIRQSAHRRTCLHRVPSAVTPWRGTARVSQESVWPAPSFPQPRTTIAFRVPNETIRVSPGVKEIDHGEMATKTTAMPRFLSSSAEMKLSSCAKPPGKATSALTRAICGILEDWTRSVSNPAWTCKLTQSARFPELLALPALPSTSTQALIACPQCLPLLAHDSLARGTDVLPGFFAGGSLRLAAFLP